MQSLSQSINLGLPFTHKLGIFGERVIQQLVYYSKSKVVFDMLFWNTREGEIIYNYSERHYRLKMRSSFLSNRGQIKFYGKEYPIPKDIEGYLEWLYGNDWRIPKPQKGDWKNDCRVLEDLKNIGL